MRGSLFDVLSEVGCEPSARAALQTARAVERVVIDVLERFVTKGIHKWCEF
jgi:hypothetical protein